MRHLFPKTVLLVHVERAKFYQPRMPRAVSRRNSPVRYHTDRHGQRKGVVQPVLLVEVLRADPSGENVSRPTTGLQNGQYQAGLSVGTNHFFSGDFFFAGRDGSRYSTYSKGTSVPHVAQTFEDVST